MNRSMVRYFPVDLPYPGKNMITEVYIYALSSFLLYENVRDHQRVTCSKLLGKIMFSKIIKLEEQKMATYRVTTDTHGSPWGENNVQQADFDLGDNTPFYSGAFPEPPHNPSGNKLRMQVLGNHDMAFYNAHPEISKPNLNLCTSWTDSGKTICALGFNSAEDQNRYNISSSQILDAFNYLQSLPNNTHVMVLTHNPLFSPILGDNNKTGDSYDSKDQNKWTNWNGSVAVIISMLKAYRSSSSKSFYINNVKRTFTKTGYVIGCFCGHIHNHVQCYDSGLYMEAFGTNGSDQWTKDGNLFNAGLYVPPTYSIVLDPTNYKVNNHPYINIDDDYYESIITENTNSGIGQGTSATGAVTFKPNYGNYPKFRTSRYIGYSKSPEGGVTSYWDEEEQVTKYRNNFNNGYWPVDDITVNGIKNGSQNYVNHVEYIRFDTSGLLRYYSTSDESNSAFIEIPNYQSVTITFTTKNGYTWTFRNGLYNGYVKA